jgi:hypothetical protein
MSANLPDDYKKGRLWVLIRVICGLSSSCVHGESVIHGTHGDKAARTTHEWTRMYPIDYERGRLWAPIRVICGLPSSCVYGESVNRGTHGDKAARTTHK